MIVLKHASTGETQYVFPDGIDLDDLGDWSVLGEAPEALQEHEFFDEVKGRLATDWDAVDAELHAKIDTEALEAREKLDRYLSGQSAIYAEKRAEALAWQAGEASTTDFVYIRKEAQKTGRTITAVASSILAKVNDHEAKAEIESERVAAKRRVSLAATREEKEAVLLSLAWR